MSEVTNNEAMEPEKKSRKKKVIKVEVPDTEVIATEETPDETPVSDESSVLEEAFAPEETPATEASTEKKVSKKSRSSKKKEKTEDDRVKEGTNFFAKPVSLADKETHKKLRKKEHVFAEDGEREFNAEGNAYDEEFKELAGSAKSKRILVGELAGMRHTDPDNIESTLIADIKFKTGALQVNIPSDLLFDYDPDSFRGEGGARQLEEIVKSRITGTVRFIVRSVDEHTGIAYADALAAQAQVVNRYYINNWPKLTHPKLIMHKGENGETIGPLVKARVVSTGFSHIVVDAIGAEIKINLDELSYQHITDPRDKYRVNDKITVRLLSIEKVKVKKRNNEYDLIRATASVKQVYPDDRKLYFDKFAVDGIYSATITYIDDNGHVFCSLKDQYDCLCKYPVYGQKPLIGQKKVVKVTNKDPEKLYIFGTFIGG